MADEESNWEQRYFAKHGEVPSPEYKAKRAAAQAAFDAKEHLMIDMVTGEPRWHLRQRGR
jgi:hypothetical protein